LSVKKELRERLRKVLSAMTPAEQSAKSQRACAFFLEQPEFQRAEIVMVFLSLPGEIDTTPIVLRAWQTRKRILAPKVSWEQRRMLPVEIRSLGDDLAQTPLGAREPISGIPFPIPLIDLVIVPGLGFDEFGNRLGRGRGFYDRFLAHPEFRGTSCAMAFAEQVVATVPVGPLDRAVDMLVTDTEVRRFAR
jgi:5-formyltetrahydrofolate cyclo-ligase